MKLVRLICSLCLLLSPIIARSQVVLKPSGGDDASQIQAAVNTGQHVFLEAGTWTLNNTIVLWLPSHITGAGKALTNIHANIPIAFQIASGVVPGQQNNEAACELEEFSIFVQAPSSAAIYQQSSTTNGGSVLRHIAIYNSYIGVEWVTADNWIMDDVAVIGFTKYGVWIRNILDGDDGDETMTNCYVNGGLGTGLCIYQQSADGLRVNNTKMLGGAVGLQLDPGPGASGDLELVMDSIENQSIAGVMITAGFSQVGITGCEFQSQFIPIYMIGVQRFSITGNTIVSVPACAAVLAFNCVGTITGNAIGAKPVSLAGGSVVQSGNN